MPVSNKIATYLYSWAHTKEEVKVLVSPLISDLVFQCVYMKLHKKIISWSNMINTDCNNSCSHNNYIIASHNILTRADLTSPDHILLHAINHYDSRLFNLTYNFCMHTA